jgi:hypothetical protein
MSLQSVIELLILGIGMTSLGILAIQAKKTTEKKKVRVKVPVRK